MERKYLLNLFPKTKVITRMSLYELNDSFALVGSDKASREQHVITIKKVDDTEPHTLESIIEDEFICDKKEIFDKYAEKLKDNNSLFRKIIKDAYGILGFVKFLKGYYLILITECKLVAKIGRHDIFTIKNTEMIRLFSYNRESRTSIEDEKKYKNIFKKINLNKCFYFSYTYNLTIKFQEMVLGKLRTNGCEQKNTDFSKNFTKREESEAEMSELRENSSISTANFLIGADKVKQKQEEFNPANYYPWNETFMWNYTHIKEFFSIVDDKKWILPVTHGYINCSNFDLNNNFFNVILIARRSRHFAGTRYLKRGINEEGRAANFVEIEQIVYNHQSKDDKPLVSSFVQIRGSIPLFWSQDPNPLVAKPEIFVNTSDLDYLATKRHFCELFQHYSFPIIIYNLTKKCDTRESKLSTQYQYAVEEVLNSELPEDKQIFYAHFDVKKKKKKTNFLSLSFQYIESFLKHTGVFYTELTNPGDSSMFIHLQKGVTRTNCIDSLDRTNMMQHLIGFVSLKKQLHVLGILGEDEKLPNNSLICQDFQKHFEIMGDEISLQYGGSIAHKGNINKKKSIFKGTLPELWTSVKRHWANNFSDASKQGAINLFLGMYIPSENSTPLWNLNSDIILHQCDKDKLPRLQKYWWDHFLKRYEEKLPKERRNKALDFYVPYSQLNEVEKVHFLPEQKISIKKILEVDEVENITGEEKHYYIFDGIEQIIQKEIEKWLEEPGKEEKVSRSMSPRSSSQNIEQVAQRNENKELKAPELNKTKSFYKYLLNNERLTSNPSTKFTGMADDMALLNPSSEMHQEVDSHLHAFDDLSLIKKKSNQVEDERFVHLEKKLHNPRGGDSLLKTFGNDLFDYEELQKNTELHKSKMSVRKSYYLSPTYFDKNNEEESKNVPDHVAHRNTSFSKRSGIKKKASDLAKLYEFDPEDDRDPYYELYNCQQVTFLEQILNDPMNTYQRVELKPPTCLFKLPQYKKDADDPPKEADIDGDDNNDEDREAEEQKAQENKKISLYKRNYKEAKKILKPVYFDDEETKIFRNYIESGPNVIEKRAQYDLNKKIVGKSEEDLMKEYFEYITPTYSEKDFKKFEDLERSTDSKFYKTGKLWGMNYGDKSDYDAIKKYLKYSSMSTTKEGSKKPKMKSQKSQII